MYRDQGGGRGDRDRARREDDRQAFAALVRSVSEGRGRSSRRRAPWHGGAGLADLALAAFVAVVLVLTLGVFLFALLGPPFAA